MLLPAWVLEKIATLPEKFTGQVRINCFGGGVTNINIEVSVKPEPAGGPPR